MKIKKRFEKSAIAITQISLMVIAIFAFAFILNGSFVSAEDKTQDEGDNNGGETSEMVQKYVLPSAISLGIEKLSKKGTEYLKSLRESTAASGESALSGEIASSDLAIATEQTTAVSESLAAGEGVTVLKENIWTKLGLAKKSGGLTFFGSALSVVATSTSAGFLTRAISKHLGASEKQSNTVGWIAGAGALGTQIGGNAFGILGAAATGLPWWAVSGIGAFIISIGLILFYKKEPVEVVIYNCLAWQAQSGGEFCDECNHGEFPCTEYQCKSLGQSCEIINKGTDDELCYFSNRQDIRPPTIEVNRDKYDSNIIFEPYGSTQFPEDRGVKLVNTNTRSGCYAPYEPILFAIKLDEPGICKYSIFRDSSFNEMGNLYFSNGYSRYNHSTSFNMPGRAEIEAENLTFFEGLNSLYVRCEDPNANQNIANYVFDFCVDESPDLTEPVILGTNPLTNSYISFDTSSIDSTFYIDKPAECKWDHFDMSFDQMQNSMSCATSIGDGINLNQRLVYPCKTTLTGLQNYVPNDFYISCKSYPNKDEVERMEMGQSYKYTLIGTRPLAIDSVAPDNETMRGSAEIVTVNLEATTIEGAENDGTATCFYDLSNSGKNVEFFETDSYRHTQELFLGAGNYNIKITCVDAGGNIAIDYANFRIEVDKQAPIITRAYYENNRIVLMTNEEATCVYNTNTCDQSYDDSIKISSSDDLTHNLAWDTEQNLYIKCEDQYGNRPMPKECSIIVRGHELFSLTN